MIIQLLKKFRFLSVLFIFQVLPATAQEVVSPADIGNGWYIGDTRPDGMVSFVTGPKTPPMGCGSLQMTLTLYTGKAQFLTDRYKGTELSDITALSYWSYRQALSQNNPVQTISLNIEVDYNGAAPGGNTVLVFEPVYQSGGGAAVQEDVWQYWDAYQGGNAIWWSEQPMPGVCALSCFVTWNQILAANPDAVITGGLGFVAGWGWFGPFAGNADALTVGVNGQNTVYNFEPSEDADGDNNGDICDTDDDNDGVPDAYDCAPNDAKNDKVIVCHNGKEICVSQNAVAAHMKHGDQVGPCTSSTVTAAKTSRRPGLSAPSENRLLDNKPNPYSGSTTLQYELAEESRVSLKVFDIMGREVANVVEATRKAGLHTVTFQPQGLQPGVYYYRIIASSGSKIFQQTSSMILQR